MSNWYDIKNVADVPSPQLVVYPERVSKNIARAIAMVGDVNRLRPHVKTNKTPEVVRMMIEAGISKFKFATVEEGEMLAEEHARDALMAYQPVGPKVGQLAGLVMKYPGTRFSCVLDSEVAARELSAVFSRLGIELDVYLDLDVGMHRTGISAGAFDLYTLCCTLPSIRMKGIHAYDGHLRSPDLEERTLQCDQAFSIVETLAKRITNAGLDEPVIIAGGSPSFPIHARRQGVECSPGTFVFWDKGYSDICPEQPFEPAVLVLTRVISLPVPGRATVDMGHKSIAAENDISRRAWFMDDPGLVLSSQSEEHGVISLTADAALKVGDALYVLPYHICPTVNLYQKMITVVDGRARDSWTVEARH
jgi:D-serine deaminase-like pyridoxal phosphate-dependent protein